MALRVIRAVSLLGILLALSGCAHPPEPRRSGESIVPARALSALDLLLQHLHLSRQDIGINRSIPLNDPFLLRKVASFLKTPLQVISFADECSKAFDQGPESFLARLKLAAVLLEVDASHPRRGETTPPPVGIDDLPSPGLRRVIEVLYGGLVRARQVFDQAFDAAGREKADAARRDMESLLLSHSGEEGEARVQREERTGEVFAVAARVDRRRLVEASLILASAVDEALEIVRGGALLQAADLLKDDVLTLKTPLGEIRIGGSGDHRHGGDMPLLLVDLGGNDEYGFDGYSPFSVILDLSGNDIYRSSERGRLGAGVMGIGFLVDLEGDDLYVGDDIAFGAGFFGVGVLADRQGNDRYISGSFSQGAGAVGIGLLWDGEGDDFYQTALYGQGFGFVGGGGFLWEGKGNDAFVAGGVVLDHREPGSAYQTFSQGFGLGWRSFASGGIGMLYDGEGDDLYEGSYFSQGSSYWLSLGMLIDRQGNDRYRARRYSQGAGIHWSVGALIDGKGNDSYLSWGVSQGCGHDRSVGILWDGQGDDTYQAEWLSQGAGNATGTGILIDEEGNDRYEAGGDGTQGAGKWDDVRDEGSLGLLVDGAGRDLFSRERANRNLWADGRWGGGIDYEGSLSAFRKEPFPRDPVTGPPAPATLRRREGERPWVILPPLEGPLVSEDSWTKAAEELLRQGPSVMPALLQYLEIKEVLVHWALRTTFRRMAEHTPGTIYETLDQEGLGPGAKKFLLYALGDVGNRGSEKTFLKFLGNEDPSLQAAALRGLFRSGLPPPAGEVSRLVQSDDVDVRRYLCLALRSCQPAEALGAVTGLLRDRDFNVRFLALEALEACRSREVNPSPD